MKRKEAITVTGMSCAVCAGTIEKVLGAEEGVSSAVVNLTTEKAVVEFDDSLISLEDIYEKIEAQGYGVIGKKLKVKTTKIK